jgi:hypothetical protein
VQEAFVAPQGILEEVDHGASHAGGIDDEIPGGAELCAWA